VRYNKSVEALALAPAAFLAGILMFLAPCTLPIIPGYLVFIAGSPAGVVDDVTRRRRIVLNAVAFVIGFSLIFIALGVFAVAIGSLLGSSRELISRGAGLILILFGLMMLKVLRLPVLGSEWRTRIPRFLAIGRWESSLLIGALFALGWSPCVGPILGTVLLFASTSATIWQGALLLAVFSLGLGVPFILTALLIDRAGTLFNRWAKGANILSMVGGVLLVALGVSILFGMMGVVVEWCYRIFDYVGYNRLYEYL